MISHAKNPLCDLLPQAAVRGLSLLLLWVLPVSAARLESPNGRVTMNLELTNGAAGSPRFDVQYDGRPVLVPSALELQIGGKPFAAGLTLVKETRRDHDASWRPVYGERDSIRDHYREAVFELAGGGTSERRLTLVFRAYDTGVAFCYEIPAQPGHERIHLDRELTEFRFASDHSLWATYTAQGVYTNTLISQLRPGCERPLVLRVSPSLYAAIAEARLVDYARMKLSPLPGAVHGLVSDLSGPLASPLPLRTPWRVVMLAESPGKLLESNDLFLNLNDPCALTNTAWIKPGKVLRDVSLSTAGGKACVDFAVRQNLQYVLYDAGWYGPETDDKSDARGVHLDPSRHTAPLDLHEVLRYAKARGIGIILYVNRRALERQMDELFPLYHSWGVKGVKFGFVQVGSQEWTAWLHKAVALAARHELMVDVHDEYRPTGFSRTYPNLMTQEGVRGDEEKQPNHQALTTLFTRLLAGAADNTICYYDPRVVANSSHAYQLAKMVCFYSPWQFVFWYDRPYPAPAGAPEHNVIGDEPELEFFAHCPTVWDETRVLQGEIGEYAVIARRSGRSWFIGCMNARRPRTLTVPLDFLSADIRYTASVYADDPAAPSRTRVRIDRRTVNRTSVARIEMGSQGGQALRLVPK